MELEYKDNSRRSKFIIVLGVAMALIAGGGAFVMINQAQQQGSGGPGLLVPVVVAARSIPERHTITPSDLAIAQVPVDVAGSGTFSDPGKLLARITAVAILPGQPIATNLIASTAEGGQFSILKPDETIAPDFPVLAGRLHHGRPRPRGRRNA